MASLEERVSYLEGAYQHLATKEDVAEVKASIARVETSVARLETSIIKWMVGLMVSSIATACTLTLVIDRVIG